MNAIWYVVIGLAVVAAVGLIAGFVVPRRRTGERELDRRVPEVEARPRPEVPVERESEGGVVVVDDEIVVGPAVVAPEVVAEPAAAPPTFRERLARARSQLSGFLGDVLSRSKVDESTFEGLEEALILADVGADHATDLLDAVRAQCKAAGVDDPAEVLRVLKTEMASRLDDDATLHVGEAKPSIWLFVGVNGVGKTTTIGKVAHRLRDQGQSVVLAAGDTFRAAAAEQLGLWADRSAATLVRGSEGADPSSVIFDAVARAAASGTDVVLADTAGRLHTKDNLMAELSKVRRVADKGEGQVDEVLLVIDATTGRNGLTQAEKFREAADITGVVLTKLDGSAKGGIVYAIHESLGVPIKLVGLGEKAQDLVPFDATEFVDALFD